MLRSNSSVRTPFSILAVSCTTLLWGLSYAATKGLLQSFTPIEIAVFRFVIAAFALVSLAAVTGRLRPIKRTHWLRATVAGVIGVPVYFLFENFGLNYTSASAGSLIIATIPILNLVVSWITRGERVTIMSTLGVLLSFSGVYLLVSIASDPSDGSSLGGNLLILGAALSWVVYTRINAPLVKEYDLITLNTIETCIGTLALIPVGLATGLNTPRLSLQTALGLAYLGLLCSAIAYVLYFVALRGLGSVTVTCFINLVPVFGVAGAVALLGERVTSEQLWGGLMILVGVALVTVHRPGDSSTPALPQPDSAPC